MALKGLKVVEMAGLAPAPLAGLILSDFGASVVRVDRPGQPPMDTLARSKRSICVSLKHDKGIEVVKDLCNNADILIEPYRPGVMEKLGLGPQSLCSLNPRLIYARLTGYGQTGPMAHKAGHDINYLALSGVLSKLGRSDSGPHPPINLLADFAGGSLMCVIGILMSLVERNKSGRGQVIDTSMAASVSYLSTFLTTSDKLGIWTGPRGTNLLDGGAPFYDTFKTSDGQYMAVGAIEPQFYSQLLKGLGIEEDDGVPGQLDVDSWPEFKMKLAKVFETKTRKEWTDIFSELDACVEPVLTMTEAVTHPHNKNRDLFSYDSELDSHVPNPEPRLSRNSGSIGSCTQPEVGEHSVERLRDMKYTEDAVSELLRCGAVVQSSNKSKL